ncbi:DODA-type extradiol aromatic ring-opening family dioxygenase [Paenibacillus sp. GCM10023248]|uniref:DODA-type extradiol aromatic ring-opening family dioxygenase n=1 Tax=Bacillales TaxID=1385 RepID=UPI002377F230|nr:MULTISPECIES: class III extradiol ring-cleavage dioxygenase [Bacillales]MDD9266986.1 class III extradiol ring-cleavage dioxygenase [Paenibacillus sp. MAHUQ-63]MDR6881186.1 4,5-DOPA dioxygenase extradiol [Bacillus sp. 3255]
MISPIFIGHGSPMMAIQHTACTEFLSEYGRSVSPKAIVIFTAHWETEVLTISSTDDEYETIYDFGGFPKELFQIKYGAKGSKAIAGQLAERFQASGIQVNLDTQRGLDHGSWVPLLRMFPTPVCPVIQVSVHPYLPPAEQYRIGEALRGLDQEDILIVGSGATVHNLRALNWEAAEPDAWAVAFDDWLVNNMQERNLEALFNYAAEAPHARLAVPRPEHFIPLYIAMGSGDPARKPQVIHRSYELGSLSYLAVSF